MSKPSFGLRVATHSRSSHERLFRTQRHTEASDGFSEIDQRLILAAETGQEMPQFLNEHLITIKPVELDLLGGS
jgi:hypothetical protein